MILLYKHLALLACAFLFSIFIVGTNPKWKDRYGTYLITSTIVFFGFLELFWFILWAMFL